MLLDVGKAFSQELRVFFNAVSPAIRFYFARFHAYVGGYLFIREHAVSYDEIDLLLSPAVVHRHTSHSKPY